MELQSQRGMNELHRPYVINNGWGNNGIELLLEAMLNMFYHVNWNDQRPIFKCISTNAKFFCFVSNFTQVCCKASNWQEVSIGSGNGLAPNRRQAIIWTNAEPIGTVNYSQKHGSRAGEASKTTESGYRSALAAGCSLLTALYIRT